METLAIPAELDEVCGSGSCLALRRSVATWPLWEAALIKRVGNDVLEVGPQPQIIGDDLTDQLIARHKRAA